MKHFILCFIFLFTFNVFIQAQEKYTVSAGITLPVPIATTNYYSLLGSEVEFLKNFKLTENVKISTGLGFLYGDHVRQETVGNITKVNGKLNIYKGTGYRNIRFMSIEIPVLLAIPFKKASQDLYTAGFSFGQFLNTKLIERGFPNVPHLTMNKTYLDFYLGVSKNIYKSDKSSINLSPLLGYFTYLSQHNNWQKNYIFSQIKFNLNF